MSTTFCFFNSFLIPVIEHKDRSLLCATCLEVFSRVGMGVGIYVMGFFQI